MGIKHPQRRRQRDRKQPQRLMELVQQKTSDAAGPQAFRVLKQAGNPPPARHRRPENKPFRRQFQFHDLDILAQALIEKKRQRYFQPPTVHAEQKRQSIPHRPSPA